MKKQMVIDIETMGVNDRAPILSIGMVAMTSTIQKSHYANVRWREYDFPEYRNKFQSDFSTIAWWMRLGDAAKKFLATDNSGCSLRAFCSAIRDFYLQNNCGEIWANHPQFDVKLVEYAFRICNYPIPWLYNQVFDTATIKQYIPQNIKDEFKKRYVQHYALDDALYEAECLRWWQENMSRCLCDTAPDPELDDEGSLA